MAAGHQLALCSDKGAAILSHYAFGQLARTVGAPAGYLRDELSGDLAAACLNHGLQTSPVGTVANVLVRAANGNPHPVVRACTSETYGRVWDASLYSAAASTVFSQARAGHAWESPTAWDGKPSGVWRGDRDSFVIQVDGGSIVTDPSARDGQSQMYRGLMLRNSEVGASSIVIECVLFRWICGNLMLWGATIDSTFRRRHVGGEAALRSAIRELGTVARRWADRPASQDEAIIRTLIERELATTKKGVIDELRAMGATLEQATHAYETCERAEGAAPRSFWGISQGLTRDSQDTAYQNERYELDQLAARVLARGAKLVAA